MSDPYPLLEFAQTVLAPAGGSSEPLLIGSATGNSGTTLVVPLSPSTIAGTTLIVLAGSFQSSANPVVSAIELGGTNPDNFAVINTAYLNGTMNAAAWSDINCAGGAASLTITFTGGSGTNPEVGAFVFEVGNLTGTPVDAHPAGSNATGVGPSAGPTGPLAQANEVAFGLTVMDALGGAALTPPGPPWVSTGQITAGSGLLTMAASYQALDSVASLSYNSTLTSSTIYGTLIFTLKVAGAAGPAPGSGTVTISPGQPGAPGCGVGASRNSGLTWDVDAIAVNVSTNVSEAQASAYLSYGILSATATDFLGQTQTGSTGDTCSVGKTLKPGDWMTVKWTGGDPGAVATARIFGTVNPPNSG